MLSGGGTFALGGSVGGQLMSGPSGVQDIDREGLGVRLLTHVAMNPESCDSGARAPKMRALGMWLSSCRYVGAGGGATARATSQVLCSVLPMRTARNIDRWLTFHEEVAPCMTGFCECWSL